ncbi:MAG: hypothetical protein R6X27_06340 [Candidatus Desulfacyla sp.]
MPPKQIHQRPEKIIPELSSFTVMISRGLGKVRSFSFSSRFLLWASIIFTLYIIVSAVGIYLYLGELRKETVQSDRVKQLAYETQETRRALYQARQRLKLLEDTIYNMQGTGQKEIGTPKSEVSHPGREESVSEAEARNSSAEESSFEPLVTIQGLTTKRSGERLSVNFRLDRIKPDGSQLSGHLFIIAANTASDPPRFWTRPRTDLKDGIPVDYKRGQAFKVRNYRVIRENLIIDSAAVTPLLLSILAYDVTGELILDQAFAIEEAQ